MSAAADSPTARAKPYVLDTFAFIAYAQGEPAGTNVEALLTQAESGAVSIHMSVVNVAEVLYIIRRRGGEKAARETLGALSDLAVSLHAATLDLALQAAALKAERAISLADCFAAALAQQLDAAVVTGDPDFKQLGDVIEVEWI